MSGIGSPPTLDTARHLRYWKRCFRTFLPHQYTSNDSIRMTLGFFILAAIDLLSPTSTPPAEQLVTPSDRRRLRDWVLECQHPQGGFWGSPTHAVPVDRAETRAVAAGEAEENPGAANIAATSFALLLLALLAEDGDAAGAYAGVDRVRTLRWLRRLQREDGSFGEVLMKLPAAAGDEDGRDGGRWVPAGGTDMRYCYLAATIRWMLRGDVREGDEAWVEDIDVDGLVAHIRRGQTYDGGVAESSQHESHAGYACCAIAALALLDRPSHKQGTSFEDSEALRRGIADHAALTEWLASRQLMYLEHNPGKRDDIDGDDPENANFAEPPSLTYLSLDESIRYIGFNGRCNKIADTCYTWWVSGALSILGHPVAVTSGPSRAFLIAQTQHVIGGFSKYPGGPPDVYHGYLGLAALATMDGGEPALKEFDATLCVSAETVRKIEEARDSLLRAERAGRDPDGLVGKLLGMGQSMMGGRPEWLAAVV
ncbi:Prenyltransferase and squalene oxidase [Pleurostoma richardsiae]|uniref:Prenyltransferase and squalene oxidase n=1 Tax=Pleurostoma richardsiae TaxID=41990 RepID=A0AA38RBZ4_9PEZI|nr:Prenyltransferase and squalene oxidase [Pleurostoma richardsiae]